MSTISVIIPSHNRGHLLPRALDSVLAQTRPPAEIIVVDDGSSDGTAAMLAADYPEVRCLRQPNEGVSGARNRGIMAAQGEWIALLDSDDQWQPEKLAIQMEALAAAPGHLLCHTDEIWIRNGRRVNPMDKHAKAGGWIFQHCLPLCAISPSSALIHRGLFDEVGLFDPELPACEDYDMWLRICARHPVCYVDQPLLVKYGGHADQLSRRHWGMDRFRIRALARILDSGLLGSEDSAALRATLLEKIRIYLNGARKRNKWAEVAHYEALAGRCREARSA